MPLVLRRRAAAARVAHRGHRPRRGGTRPRGDRGRDDARLEGARPGAAGGRGHRLHRRDDRRRGDAAGHQHPALPAAHHRRGPVAGRGPGDDLDLHRIRNDQGPDVAREGTRSGRQAVGQHPRPDVRRLQHALGPGRDPPAGRGDRRRGQHGAAAGRESGRKARTGACRCQCRHVPRIRPGPRRGSGQALSAGANGDGVDHALPAQAGRASGPGRRALHHPREAFDAEARLGPLALGHAEFLCDRKLRRRRQRDLCARAAELPGKRPGPALRAGHCSRRRRQDQQRGGARQAPRDAPAHRLRLDQREDVPGRDEGGSWTGPGLHSGKLPRCRHPARHRHAIHGLRGRNLRPAGGLQRAFRRAFPHPAAGQPDGQRTGHACHAAARLSLGHRRPGRARPHRRRASDSDPHLRRADPARRGRKGRARSRGRTRRQGNRSGAARRGTSVPRRRRRRWPISVSMLRARAMRARGGAVAGVAGVA